ncbi:MAG: hypothetical protein ACI4SF_01595 [Oscillospiraceae bacterium]
MNYNYETMQMIMEGSDLLYTMIQELNDGIRSLPGCKMTANLKRLSANIGATSNGIYQTMRSIGMGAEVPCEQCLADMDEYNDADIPSGSDLKEFLDKIAGILVSDKPVSISADIYINEGHSENAGNDYDDDEDDE